MLTLELHATAWLAVTDLRQDCYRPVDTANTYIEAAVGSCWSLNTLQPQRQPNTGGSVDDGDTKRYRTPDTPGIRQSVAT
jgi:hypothetical protein